MKFEEIYFHIYGADQGDRLNCLLLEAAFLGGDSFACEVWNELKIKLVDAPQRAAAKALLAQAAIREALYKHYINTRPQLRGGFVAVSCDGPLWAICHKDYVQPCSPAWHGWPGAIKKHGFKGLEVHRCTDRVLDEVVMKGPFSADAIVRVQGTHFDCYYHREETRPTSTYQ